MSISVLYIHHVGPFGGSSRSLIETVNAFPGGEVKPHVITPAGAAADFFEDAGFSVLRTRGISQFSHGRAGYYHGLRWLILLREIYYSLFTIWAILTARKRWRDIDLVHVNECTPMLAICMAKMVYKTPLVVHARSLMETKKGKNRRKVITYLLKRYADTIIAIDESVRRTLPDGLSVYTVHNGFSLSQKDERNGEFLKKWPSINRGKIVVGIVGVLLKAKGVYEFIEAARICRERGLNTSFVVVGDDIRNMGGLKKLLLEKSGLVQDIKRADIESLIQGYGLSNWVHCTGFISNTRSVYKNIDILCFPSHLEAVGRPVFEAAFFKVPSIVAISDPPDDVIIDGQTGICIPPYDPEALADAIEVLATSPNKRKEMGLNAFELALSNFSAEKNSHLVLQIYKDLLAEGREEYTPR